LLAAINTIKCILRHNVLIHLARIYSLQWGRTQIENVAVCPTHSARARRQTRCYGNYITLTVCSLSFCQLLLLLLFLQNQCTYVLQNFALMRCGGKRAGYLRIRAPHFDKWQCRRIKGEKFEITAHL